MGSIDMKHILSSIILAFALTPTPVFACSDISPYPYTGDEVVLSRALSNPFSCSIDDKQVDAGIQQIPTSTCLNSPTMLILQAAETRVIVRHIEAVTISSFRILTHFIDLESPAELVCKFKSL